MNGQTLEALRERVRSAKGADWKLDEDILRALGWQVRVVSRLGLGGKSRGGDRAFPPGSTSATGYPVPKITASVDAALTLVKKALPEAQWCVGSMESGPFCRLIIGDGRGGYLNGERLGEAATAPLAMLDALIFALLTRAGVVTE